MVRIAKLYVWKKSRFTMGTEECVTSEKIAFRPYQK